MTSRVILFGATGYTGTLIAEALARNGTPRVVLAGRNSQRLRTLAATLEEAHDWTCDIAEADASEYAEVADLIGSADDVLVSTVGPFTRYGKPAIEAATSAGAIYLDSTGEPPFIRRVFEHYGPRAKRTGATLLTAFGYDYIPGNLAGTLALRQAADSGFVPTRVDVGYFVPTTGTTQRSVSSGTVASTLAILSEPGFAWHEGAIHTERPGASVRSFVVDGRELDGLSLGGTEHYTLPAIDPRLRDVNVYLGWAGSRTRTVSQVGAVLEPLTKVPVLPKLASSMASRIAPTASGGPSAADRSAGSTLAIAEVFAGDRLVARVRVGGPSPYDLTAELLAWAAAGAQAGAVVTSTDGTGESRTEAAGGGKPRRKRRARVSGALGPAQAFGAAEFVAGCASVGLVELD